MRPDGHAGDRLTDRSDRISLSWQQLIYGVTTLLAIAGSYFGVRSQISELRTALTTNYYTKHEIDAFLRDQDHLNELFDRRIERLEAKPTRR